MDILKFDIVIFCTITYQGRTQRIFCTSKSLSGVALVAEEKDARSAQSETKQQDKKKVKL